MLCSCTTTTVLASVFTAVFVGCGSVVIHIAYSVHQCKYRKSVKAKPSSTGDGDTARMEPIYEDVADLKERGEVIKMDENDAYARPPWLH